MEKGDEKKSAQNSESEAPLTRRSALRRFATVVAAGLTAGAASSFIPRDASAQYNKYTAYERRDPIRYDRSPIYNRYSRYDRYDRYSKFGR